MISCEQIKLVIDTPNVLFHKNHIKGQLERNLLALLNFISTNKYPVICIITPLMHKIYKSNLGWLKSIVEANNGKVYASLNRDPDIVALEIADELQIPILTNDKFKQKKYRIIKSKIIRITFSIHRNTIKILSKKQN